MLPDSHCTVQFLEICPGLWQLKYCGKIILRLIMSDYFDTINNHLLEVIFFTDKSCAVKASLVNSLKRVSIIKSGATMICEYEGDICPHKSSNFEEKKKRKKIKEVEKLIWPLPLVGDPCNFHYACIEKGKSRLWLITDTGHILPLGLMFVLAWFFVFFDRMTLFVEYFRKVYLDSTIFTFTFRGKRSIALLPMQSDPSLPYSTYLTALTKCQQNLLIYFYSVGW